MITQLVTTGSEAAQKRAAQALWSLVHDNPSAHEAIARAGDTASLVDLLTSGISSAQDYALWSLSLSISPDTQAIAMSSGGVEPLIAKLADRRVVIQEQSAQALAKLARENEETQAAITEQGGVVPLIQLLKDGGNGVGAAPKLSISPTDTRGPSPIPSPATLAPPAGALHTLAPSASATGRHSPSERQRGRSITREINRPVASPERRDAKFNVTAEAVLQNAANALANLAPTPAARDEIVS